MGLIMLSSDVLNSVLFFCSINTAIFLLTSYFLFCVYKLPMYHVMSFYQVYYFFGFVVRPWELYFTGTSHLWEYVGFIPSSGVVLWSAFVIILAHASMLAGFVLINGECTGVPTIRPFSFVPQRPIVFFVIALLFILLGAYSSTVLFGDASSLEDLLAVNLLTDDSGGSRNIDISGYQTIFEELIPVTLIVLFATRRMRAAAIALIVAFVIYRLFAGFARAKFVLTLLTIACILLIETRRRYPPAKLLAAGMLLLALFNFVGSDRLALRKIRVGEMTFSESFNNYWQGSGAVPITGDMKEFDTLAAVLSVVPEMTGYTYGTQYLRLLVWPIPRQLWADKPVNTSIVNLLRYGNFLSMTITLYADSYMTLGIAGMIVVLFAISMFMNSLYNNTIKRESPSAILTYFM